MALSVRSVGYLPASDTPLATAINEAWKNVYCPHKNPQGVVILAVAENILLQDWLVKKFKENFDLEPSDLSYQSVGGPDRFKDAMSYILNRYFNPALPVKPEHLLCGSGITALLPQLIYAICDEGDSVLVSKPYYSGFDHLLKQGVNLVNFVIENPLDPNSVSEALEKTYIQDKAQGQKIKAVILCNPHNPLGYCAPKEALICYLKFCQTYNLHLIVDEIYGLSVFKEDETSHVGDHHPRNFNFVSMLSFDLGQLGVDPSRLHVFYGISKDFGCCGLRGGTLISQSNPKLLSLLKNLTMNQVQVSSMTSRVFGNLVFGRGQGGADVGDGALLDTYLAENKRLMREAYDYVTGALDALKISYHQPSNAGFFLMIDLSAYLSNLGGTDKAKEEECMQRLLVEHKSYLSPGMVYHHPKPGFFRFTFTAPRDHLEIALRRLAEFVQSSECASPTIETLTLVG